MIKKGYAWGIVDEKGMLIEDNFGDLPSPQCSAYS